MQEPVAVTGAFTVKVNVEVLVTDPAVAVTVTVEFPVGVDERVFIVRVEVQIGEQAVGEKEDVTPDGSPETVKLVDCAVPEERVAVTLLVTEEPWVTDLLPPFVRVKLKAVGAVTLTVVDWLVVLPAPVQERVKVELVVRLPVDPEPEVDLFPDHAPDAVQEVALVEYHVRVDAVPDVIEVGLAVRETVGAGVTPVPTVVPERVSEPQRLG